MNRGSFIACQHITSRQNERIKSAARLRDRRQRAQQGRILIDGGREICRAIDAGVEVVAAFVCDELCRSASASNAREKVRQIDVDYATVTADVFAKLRFGDRQDGIVVVASTPRRSLDGLRVAERPLIVVLEALEKPGNVGAIVRTADGAGVDAVIVADPHTDLFNPNAIRASMGAIFQSHIVAAPSRAAFDWLRDQGVHIVAARPDAACDYCQVDYLAGAAVVLGSEANGLSDVWAGPDVAAVSLPMLGQGDSLNVSVAAGVLMYEAQRQRRAHAL